MKLLSGVRYLRFVFWLPAFFQCSLCRRLRLARSAGTLLSDAGPLLEAEVNCRLQLVVTMANRPVTKPTQLRSRPALQYPACEEERLYDALAWDLARPVIGQLETFAEEHPQISRRRVVFCDSVYRNFIWQQSPSLVLSERVAAVIRVDDVEIGSDKLGHFFTEGYSYFEVTDRLQDSVEEGMLFGEWSESLYFGAQTTGVFSFADLAANLNGLRFWNRILAQSAFMQDVRLPQGVVECIRKLRLQLDIWRQQPQLPLADSFHDDKRQEP